MVPSSVYISTNSSQINLEHGIVYIDSIKFYPIKDQHGCLTPHWDDLKYFYKNCRIGLMRAHFVNWYDVRSGGGYRVERYDFYILGNATLVAVLEQDKNYAHVMQIFITDAYKIFFK